VIQQLKSESSEDQDNQAQKEKERTARVIFAISTRQQRRKERHYRGGETAAGRSKMMKSAATCLAGSAGIQYESQGLEGNAKGRDFGLPAELQQGRTTKKMNRRPIESPDHKTVERLARTPD